jgi:hypothetical protein
MQKVQRLRICQAACVTGREATHIADFSRKLRVVRDIEYHPAVGLRPRVGNAARLEVTFDEVGNISVQLQQARRKLLAKPFEDLADVLVEARFDDLRGALVLPFECLSLCADLVSERGDFAGHLVQSP